jgi:hypothetical protein
LEIEVSLSGFLVRENLYKVKFLLVEFVDFLLFLSFGCFRVLLFTFEFESQKVIFCDVLLLPIYHAKKRGGGGVPFFQSE